MQKLYMFSSLAKLLTHLCEVNLISILTVSSCLFENNVSLLFCIFQGVIFFACSLVFAWTQNSIFTISGNPCVESKAKSCSDCIALPNCAWCEYPV